MLSKLCFNIHSMKFNWQNWLEFIFAFGFTRYIFIFFLFFKNLWKLLIKLHVKIQKHDNHNAPSEIIWTHYGSQLKEVGSNTTSESQPPTCACCSNKIEREKKTSLLLSGLINSSIGVRRHICRAYSWYFSRLLLHST